MKRKIQLWRFVDADGLPVGPVDEAGLHAFLLQRVGAGESMTCAPHLDDEVQLEPVVGPHRQLALHRIRGSNLPSERRNGCVVPLNDNVRELAEGSHFELLPRNMVAFLGTGFSPRPGRLAEWLRIRLGWQVWIQPVVRHDVGQVLDNLSKVSRVDLSIPADEARALDLAGFFEGADDPLAPLRAAQALQEGGLISIGWSVGHDPNADQGFLERLINRLRLADLQRFNKAQARVYVEGERSAVPLDFLHDRIVAEVEIDQGPGRQRFLEPEVAHEAIQQAWTTFRDVDGVMDFVDEPEGEAFVLPPELLPLPA